MEYLAVDIADLGLVLVGQSGLNGFLRSVGQVLEDITGKVKIQGVTDE
jgi:hypothetical protein